MKFEEPSLLTINYYLFLQVCTSNIQKIEAGLEKTGWVPDSSSSQYRLIDTIWCPIQICRKVSESGWASSNVVGIICPLLGVGLTELPNSGWAKTHPAHPLTASLSITMYTYVELRGNLFQGFLFLSPLQVLFTNVRASQSSYVIGIK